VGRRATACVRQGVVWRRVCAGRMASRRLTRLCDMEGTPLVLGVSLGEPGRTHESPGEPRRAQGQGSWARARGLGSWAQSVVHAIQLVARARGPGLVGSARGPCQLFARSKSGCPVSWAQNHGPSSSSSPSSRAQLVAQLVGPAGLLSVGSKSGSASPWAQLVGPCYGPSSSVARGIQIWLYHT
jgi:hypothetical protein